jgi:hypothetical protein
MPELNPSMSKIIVQTIINGLEEAKSATENVQNKVHSIEIIVNTIDGKVANMEENVKQLLRIIRDGNGQKPLLTKFNDIENEQRFIQEFIKEQKENKKEEIKGKWQARVALVTGSLGFIAAITTAIIGLFAN